MPYELNDKLKIAVTTRALFQLEKEDRIYKEKGLEAYEQYQMEHEDDPLVPGAAFSLISALLNLNKYENVKRKVEVIVVSRSSFNTSIRVFNSIKKADINITRGIFTGSAELTPYLSSLDIDLFLTADHKDAQHAIDAKIPAAALIVDNIPNYADSQDNQQIRIAFDGDAVLFSEDSEVIYKTKGLSAFAENEEENAYIPLEKGPFFKFLMLISEIQGQLGADTSVLRTALVTARNAPAHKRVINTLRAWNVRIDETFFLGGIDKAPVLSAFGAQLFFDDQRVYTEHAAPLVPSGTVVYPSDSQLGSFEKQTDSGGVICE